MELSGRFGVAFPLVEAESSAVGVDERGRRWDEIGSYPAWYHHRLSSSHTASLLDTLGVLLRFFFTIGQRRGIKQLVDSERE